VGGEDGEGSREEGISWEALMCINKRDGRKIKRVKKQNKRETERERKREKEKKKKKKDRPSDFYCLMTCRYIL
jgi:hypothetical protein